jgi:signal transduction histidine kinase
MKEQADRIANGALRERREEIHRDLVRVNTATVVVILLTIALAVAAGIGALRAHREAEMARQANAREREELWKSYLAQAHVGRLSGVVGRKAVGLATIRAAAAIHPSAELRNEAIAHLALWDLEPTGVFWTNRNREGFCTVDAAFEHLLECDTAGTIHVRGIGEPESSFALRSTNGFVGWAGFSISGRLLAAHYQDTSMAVWDLETRSIAYRRPGVTWICFDDRGELLAVAGADMKVRVLEAATGREIAALQLDAPVYVGAFDSSGLRLALSVEGRLEVWDWPSGAKRESFESDHTVTSVAWNGNNLAAGDGNGEVHLWNLVTRRARPLQAHQDFVHRLVFHPRGGVLISASYDGTTKAWDASTGQQLLKASHGTGFQFSPDGERLLFHTHSGWAPWKVVPPEGFRAIDCASGPYPNVWHVDFSRDGQWLAATKRDGIAFFQVTDGVRAHFQEVEEARTAHFLSGDSRLLIGSASQLGVWPIRPDSPGKEPRFWLGPPEIFNLPNLTRPEPGAVNPQRNRFAIPTSHQEVSVIDLDRGLEIMRLTNAIVPRCPSFSGDGKWLATGTFHGLGTRVWSLSNGQPVHDFQEGNAGAFFAASAGFLVSGGSKRYQIFEAGTWRLVAEIATDSGSDLPNQAAFSDDSSLLAVVRERRRVELRKVGYWDAATELIPPDPQVVTWLSFSPNRGHLAVATSQDLVLLWDLRVLEEKLASLGLGWNGDEGRPGASSPGSGALAAGIARPGNPGPQWVLSVTVAALVVISCAWFLRRRQANLLAAYIKVGQVAEAQNQQLGQAQTEILHSQKMKALGTLAAGVAHDFNNLLSVVRMSNQLTAEAAPDNPEVQENAQEIEQAVQQGKKLVRSVLGYSREDPDDFKEFSLCDLVEDSVALLSRQFLSGITLTLDLDANTPQVHLARSRMEQLLLNLIVNASEAMKGHGSLTIRVRQGVAEGGTVVVRARPASRLCELSVRDTGPGIAPDMIPRLFEPFFTTKNRGAERGTGLGLSTVYRAAELDGLGITVESNLGEGAEFRILVPAKE